MGSRRVQGKLMTRSDVYPYIALAAAIYERAREDGDVRWLWSETAEFYRGIVTEYCYGSNQLLPTAQRMRAGGSQDESFYTNK